MSTVLPLAAALLVLPLLPLLVLLLLQPAAARAIAARAAIAVVRLIVFIFLSLIGHPATVSQFGWPLRASCSSGSRRMGDSTKSFTEPQPGWVSIPADVPSGAKITASNSSGGLKPPPDTLWRAAHCGRAAASLHRSGRIGIGRACQSPISRTLTIGNEPIKGHRRSPRSDAEGI